MAVNLIRSRYSFGSEAAAEIAYQSCEMKSGSSALAPGARFNYAMQQFANNHKKATENNTAAPEEAQYRWYLGPRAGCERDNGKREHCLHSLPAATTDHRAYFSRQSWSKFKKACMPWPSRSKNLIIQDNEKSFSRKVD